MELQVLTSTIAGIRAAADVITGIVRLTMNHAIKSKLSGVFDTLIDAQGRLLEAQATIAAQECRITELEKEKEHASQFRQEKTRYHAIEKGPGTVVYALKESDRGDDPPLELCAACYDQDIKSILQLTKRTPGGSVFGCSRCKSDILVPLESAGVAVQPTPRRRGLVRGR